MAFNSSDIEYAKDFSRIGTETLDGMETAVYSATLEGKHMSNISGALGSGDAEAHLKDLGDLPLMIWVDKESGCVTRMTIDVRDMMKMFMEPLFKESMGSMAEGFEFEIAKEKGEIDCRYSQFNAVPEIVIPDEARKVTAESTPDPDFDPNSIVGAWTLSGGEGEEMEQQVSAMLMMGMHMDFAFHADGTGVTSMTYGDETQSADFEYTLENGQILVEGSSMDYRIDEEGLLHLRMDEKTVLIFKRK